MLPVRGMGLSSSAWIQQVSPWVCSWCWQQGFVFMSVGPSLCMKAGVERWSPRAPWGQKQEKHKPRE